MFLVRKFCPQEAKCSHSEAELKVTSYNVEEARHHEQKKKHSPSSKLGQEHCATETNPWTNHIFSNCTVRFKRSSKLKVTYIQRQFFHVYLIVVTFSPPSSPLLEQCSNSTGKSPVSPYNVDDIFHLPSR